MCLFKPDVEKLAEKRDVDGLIKALRCRGPGAGQERRQAGAGPAGRGAQRQGLGGARARRGGAGRDRQGAGAGDGLNRCNGRSSLTKPECLWGLRRYRPNGEYTYRLSWPKNVIRSGSCRSARIAQKGYPS